MFLKKISCMFYLFLSGTETHCTGANFSIRKHNLLSMHFDADFYLFFNKKISTVLTRGVN